VRHKGRNIIVIGASAGGLDALDEVIGQLPTNLAASVFVVQHMAPESTGAALLRRLDRHRAFEGKLADHGEAFKPGKLYIARPDYHLLLKERTLLVTKGARENRHRPAIDPLFRSAAVAHGPRVIGVVLTGMLDDGTAGLIAIKKCGGIAVVQDPRTAAYAGMPQSAVDNVDVDHCVPVADIGRLVGQLAEERPGRRLAIAKSVRTEAVIAERVMSDVAQVGGLGPQVPYNCPNCGGVLWQVERSGSERYRCHTGHSFTGRALLASQSDRIEETLWTSLRMFEERKNLLNRLAKRETTGRQKTAWLERATETQVHIERIRAMLRAPQA
jgi:two-component system chemotaxis response regulator CheB